MKGEAARGGESLGEVKTGDHSESIVGSPGEVMAQKVVMRQLLLSVLLLLFPLARLPILERRDR